MMEVQSQQAETLQQARSVLNEHKKWMSQKRAPVGASSTQSSAIQTTSNADEMEGLLKTPPSDTSRSSEKPKKKKKKKQNVTPVAEEKEGRISSRNPPNDGKKANEFGSTPSRSPKLPKPSPRVLSVSPAPQALQADLLDTTDTTLLRMEKCGRLAELKFRTLVEQEQKIGSIEQELKLALASIRSEVDPQVFQNASLKDVLPLIKDHVTREAYLRYVTALTTEEDKQKKEDTDEKRRRKKKKIEDGEKDSVGDHRLLNVSGQGEQDPNFDGKMVFVTHESSSGDNDEEKTVLSRISGKSRQLPVGGADENLPKSSMKVQSTGDSGSKSPQRVLKEARVKAKREKKKKSDSSTKLSTSSEKSESMDGLNSPRYLNVSSTLLDAKDSPKINHRDSLTLQNDSQSGNKVSSLSVSPLASDPSPVLMMGKYPEKLQVSSRNVKDHQSQKETGTMNMGLDDIEDSSSEGNEDDTPYARKRDVNLSPASISSSQSSRDVLAPALSSQGTTSPVSKDFPRTLTVSGEPEKGQVKVSLRKEETNQSSSSKKGSKLGRIFRKAGSKDGSTDKSADSHSNKKDYPHRMEVSGFQSEDEQNGSGNENVEGSSTSSHGRQVSGYDRKGGSSAPMQLKVQSGGLQTSSSSLGREYPQRVNVEGSAYDGSTKETGSTETGSSLFDMESSLGNNGVMLRGDSSLMNVQGFEQPPPGPAHTLNTRGYPHEVSVQGQDDDPSRMQGAMETCRDSDSYQTSDSRQQNDTKQHRDFIQHNVSTSDPHAFSTSVIPFGSDSDEDNLGTGPGTPAIPTHVDNVNSNSVSQVNQISVLSGEGDVLYESTGLSGFQAPGGVDVLSGVHSSGHDGVSGDKTGRQVDVLSGVHLSGHDGVSGDKTGRQVDVLSGVHLSGHDGVSGDKTGRQVDVLSGVHSSGHDGVSGDKTGRQVDVLSGVQPSGHDGVSRDMTGRQVDVLSGVHSSGHDGVSGDKTGRQVDVLSGVQPSGHGLSSGQVDVLSRQSGASEDPVSSQASEQGDPLSGVHLSATSKNAALYGVGSLSSEEDNNSDEELKKRNIKPSSESKTGGLLGNLPALLPIGTGKGKQVLSMTADSSVSQPSSSANSRSALGRPVLRRKTKVHPVDDTGDLWSLPPATAASGIVPEDSSSRAQQQGGKSAGKKKTKKTKKVKGNQIAPKSIEEELTKTGASQNGELGSSHVSTARPHSDVPSVRNLSSGFIHNPSGDQTPDDRKSADQSRQTGTPDDQTITTRTTVTESSKTEEKLLVGKQSGSSRQGESREASLLSSTVTEVHPNQKSASLVNGSKARVDETTKLNLSIPRQVQTGPNTPKSNQPDPISTGSNESSSTTSKPVTTFPPTSSKQDQSTLNTSKPDPSGQSSAAKLSLSGRNSPEPNEPETVNAEPPATPKLAASFLLAEPLSQSTPRTKPALTSDWRNLAILKMLRSGKRKFPPPPYPRESEGRSLGPPCPEYGILQPTNAEILKDQLQWMRGKDQTSQGPTEGDASVPSASQPRHQVPPPSTSDNGSGESVDGGTRRTSAQSSARGAAGEADEDAEVGGVSGRGLVPELVDVGEAKPLRHPFGETTLLHTVSRVGHMKRVKALLREGHAIDAPDHNGWSPLMCTIHKEGVHLACADLLMTEGANLDHQANDGSTALHIAAYTGNVSLLELLLMNEANPVIKDDFGRLPLHWSTKPSNPKSLNLLLGKDSYIDVDAMDDSGMTCLMWAAFNNSPESIKILLDRGAEVEEKDIDGLTTIHWAIHKDNAECLRLLLSKERTFYKDKRGCTVLHRAAEYGAIKACRLIVQLRPDAILDYDKKGRSPLHWAAVSSRVDVCSFLLECGVDASIRDCHDMTSLDYARERGYDYVAALMICSDEARLDFARATRTTSMVARLNESVPETIDAVAMPTTQLQNGGLDNGGEDLDTVSLHSLVRSPSINSLLPIGNLTSAKPGQALQGYLGIFTLNGKGPFDRKYFWIDESMHSLCWSGDEKSQRKFESQRVLSVQPGPSKSVRCRLDYSPMDVHKHTFRVIFDETSVFDLVAFEEKSYQLWLRELGSLAVDTFVSRPMGQPQYSNGLFSSITAITEDIEV